MTTSSPTARSPGPWPSWASRGSFDLIGCLGNFAMLAMLLNTFQVDLQPVEPPFPDVRGFARVPAGEAGPER